MEKELFIHELELFLMLDLSWRLGFYFFITYLYQFVGCTGIIVGPGVNRRANLWKSWGKH